MGIEMALPMGQGIGASGIPPQMKHNPEWQLLCPLVLVPLSSNSHVSPERQELRDFAT